MLKTNELSTIHLGGGHWGERKLKSESDGGGEKKGFGHSLSITRKKQMGQRWGQERSRQKTKTNETELLCKYGRGHWNRRLFV